jgi:amino acid transporter
MSELTNATTNTLRRGHLTLRDVVAQSVAVIAPAMSGGFLTYLAATKAGGATPLAYLLATIGALAIGKLVAEFSKVTASAGSLYTYTANGWSKTAGFVLGWMYTIGFVFAGAAIFAGFGFFSSLFVQAVTDSDTFVPWWIFTIGALVVVLALSMFHVALSTRVQLVFALISVAVMAVAAVMAIADGGPNDKSLDAAAFWPSSAGVGWGGILLGFAFGILSFTGFEAGAVLAEETADPKRNIPRAVVGSVVVTGGFYLLVTYATSIGFGVKDAKEAWPANASGLVAVVTNETVADLVLLVVALSTFIGAVGVATVVTRFLYAMGREGVFPQALGQTHPRYKTPWNAIAVFGGCCIVLIWGLLLLTTDATEIALGGGATEGVANLPTSVRGGLYAFGEWFTIASPIIIVNYLIFGLAGVREGMKLSNQKLIAVSVVATAAGALALVGSLYYSFAEVAPGAGVPYAWKVIPWLGGGLLIAGLAIATYLRTQKPQLWDGVGAVFED